MYIFKLLAALVLCTFSATGARADLRACNQTPEIVSVAIGYSIDGVWTSEGWWTMRSGDCSTMISGDLKNRYYYWRGTISGKPLPTGSYTFCTSSKVFNISGDENCAGRGFDTSEFTEVDTGDAKSHTINITMAGQPDMPPGGRKAGDDGFNDMRAKMAGSWLLETDRDFRMSFSGDRFDVSLKNSGAESGTLTYALTCPQSEGDGPVILMNPESEDNDTICLLLVNVSADRLALYDYTDRVDLVFTRP